MKMTIEQLAAAGYGPDGQRVCGTPAQASARRGRQKVEKETAPPTAGRSSGPAASGRKTSKTEAEWGRILQARRQYGEYTHVGHEEITLLLGHQCRYTPDYFTVDWSGIQLWEVKGAFIREDSMVKLRAAAARYPMFRFVLAQKRDGQWETTWIRPE